MVGAAGSANPAWLIGGTAILHLCRAPESSELFGRVPADIDLAIPKRSANAFPAFMEGQRYEPNESFNNLNGNRRLLFQDPVNDRQVDVFVGGFMMCHEVPLLERDPDVGQPTLPLAELLLMKLQIVELNRKDQLDILNILASNPVEDHDESAINGAVIGTLCAADWGLWRTVTMNLDRSQEAATAISASPDLHDRVRRRIDALSASIEAASKTRRWRMRARIGDRVRWYEEPEEVDKGITLRAD